MHWLSLVLVVFAKVSSVVSPHIVISAPSGGLFCGGGLIVLWCLFWVALKRKHQKLDTVIKSEAIATILS
ncbi:MAG: hypothetical protein F6K30_20125 [Cyanothece sp. SIO2G6]|nr:hypothetical protein [Cyanothece sp. SIO2G6]